MPRVAAFEARHAGVSVWISTRMTGQAADLSRHDVVISRGALRQGAAPAGSGQHLFDEALTPVGAVSLLRQRPVRRP